MKKGILAGLVTALTLGLAAASTPAAAADKGIYLGASVGESGVDVNSLDFSANATGYKVIAGWRFLDWLAVEGNYIDFGTGHDTVAGDDIKTNSDGLSLSAVGFLPLGPVDLFARVGAISWNSHLSSSGIGKFGDNGTDLTYGVGAQFRILSLSLRAEYEIFDLPGQDVDMLSIGLTYTFF